jgi:hypothetical protein
MLRGDVKNLATEIGVHRTTVLRRSKKVGISLAPVRGRDQNTPDMFTGKTLQDEHKQWFSQTAIALGEKQKHVPKKSWFQIIAEHFRKLLHCAKNS